MKDSRIDPVPEEGTHRLDVGLGYREGDAIRIRGIRVCGSCGALVFLRLLEMHRRTCEPRAYDLEPLSPTEIGP